MRVGAVAAWVLLGTACASDLHQDDVRIVRGVPVAEVTLNGQPTLCVLDTGELDFLVSDVFGGRPWLGIGEPEPLVVEQLAIAGWWFQGGALTVSNTVFREWEQELGLEGIDCVLGMAFFKGLRLTVDYAGQRIELLDARGRPMRGEGTTRDEHVHQALYAEWAYVGDATVQDDLEGIFSFDSGESRTILSDEAAAELEVAPQGGTLSSVEVAGSRVEDVGFRTGDSGLGTLEQLVGLRVDGKLGATFLAGHVVTWDMDAGQVILRPYEDDVRARVLSELASELDR